MNKPLRIAIADDEREMRDYLKEVLARLGHQVVAEAASGKELAEQCHKTAPDLVIADIKMPDMDGIETSSAVNRERQVPVILVSGHHDAELLTRLGADHIMGYLVKPVKEADIKTAIAVAMLRFGHFLALAKEAASLRQALEDRKVIERAKGAVMKRMGLDEEEAFRRLRKLASDRNRKLIDVARDIVAAEDVFRQMEGA
jgi:AmiR/NasT family two-component response regulator